MERQQVESSIDGFIGAKQSTREEITNEVQRLKEGINFIMFMKYAAVQSVRQNSKKLLVKGIYANVIEDGSTDIRDNLTFLTLLYHSALMIGLDPDDEFRNVAADTNGHGKDLLLAYVARTPELKTLKCMGYKTKREPEFDFVSVGYNAEYLTGPEYTELTDKKLLKGV